MIKIKTDLSIDDTKRLRLSSPLFAYYMLLVYSPLKMVTFDEYKGERMKMPNGIEMGIGLGPLFFSMYYFKINEDIVNKIQELFMSDEDVRNKILKLLMNDEDIKNKLNF